MQITRRFNKLNVVLYRFNKSNVALYKFNKSNVALYSIAHDKDGVDVGFVGVDERWKTQQFSFQCFEFRVFLSISS
jgi:hypothetical protein